MKDIKTIVSIILVMSMMLFAGCSASDSKGLITVPDVKGTDVETAKSLLSSNQLIPIVEEEYNDRVDVGTIVSTSPGAGEDVEPNSKVTIKVSKGPKRIEAKNATIQWYQISGGEDDWTPSKPYIEDGVLYIETAVVFSIATTWKESGYGRASISDTFDKTVPVEVKFDNQSNAAGEEQNIVIKVPVSDLDVQKPTIVYLNLYLEEATVECNFSMTW